MRWYPWKHLKFWESGECQVIEERLADLEKANVDICPGRFDWVNCLRLLPCDGVRVCIVGQDPYPNKLYATGEAFSIPEGITDFPPTLREIFAEYQRDLHYPAPTTGNLAKWRDQGVLLWNAIPTCTAGKSLSHDWDEYRYLTTEVLQVLSERGIVFCFVGSVARRYVDCVSLDNNAVLTTAHPSPRANISARQPFKGSRIFSAINDKLADTGLEPIDWRLP